MQTFLLLGNEYSMKWVYTQKYWVGGSSPPYTCKQFNHDKESI